LEEVLKKWWPNTNPRHNLNTGQPFVLQILISVQWLGAVSAKVTSKTYKARKKETIKETKGEKSKNKTKIIV
jgi:hypothetical protein